MNIIEKTFSPELTYSLGLMLLHLLWQGLIIALVLGMFLLFMKRSSAQSRYLISVCSVFLFPAAALITFIKTYREVLVFKNVFGFVPALGTGGVVADKGLMQSFLEMYKEYLPLIVFIWFLGITILTLRYMGLLIYVERMKNYMVKSVSDKLKLKIRDIKDRFEITRKIKVLMSGKVSSPVVIGHFKPVLLIPEQIMNSLSEMEIEIILQHELAHIKRNDYLINVIQQIIEILFFFHPAVWWVSAMTRKEREECCDSFAVKNEEDKIVLAKALTSIHELNLKTTNMALSFLNNRNGLFNRINNLFGKSNMATFREGIAVAVFFFFSIGLMSFIVHEGKDSRNKENNWKTVNTELSDGKHIYAKVDSTGDIKKMFVEGKRVGNKKMEKYQPAVDSILEAESNDMAKIIEKAVKMYSKNNKVEMPNNVAMEKYNSGDLEEAQMEMQEAQKEMLEAMQEMQEELGPEFAMEMQEAMMELQEEMGQNFNGEFQKAMEVMGSELGEGMGMAMGEMMQGLGEMMQAMMSGMNFNISTDSSIVNFNSGVNGFSMDIDDGNDKVKMNMGAGEDGFIMDIDDGDENVKVKMGADENGFYMEVTEDGKETVKMNFGNTGNNMDITDDKKSKKKNK